MQEGQAKEIPIPPKNSQIFFYAIEIVTLQAINRKVKA